MGSTFYSKRLDYKSGRNRTKRQKTFKTEAAAKRWAEKNKLESYKLVNLKSSDSKSKKFRVVVSK